MLKKVSFKTLWKILKEAVSKWWTKDPFRESATIAYYALFSIPALLAIVIAMASFVFGEAAVTGQISEQISAAMSTEAAKQVEQMVAKATEAKQSTLATIIGVITLLFGATGVLVQFQKSLNNIWEVKIDPEKKEWLHTIKSRLFSLGLIATLGFLLLISMAVTIALSALSEWLTQRFPDVVAYLIEGVNFIISISVIAVLFGLMYRILPDAKIKWRHVALGGLLTAVLFVLGKFALGFYFGKSDPASAYGAAGSVVLILLWVSYSSMIVFLGAEFTRAYVVHTGGKVVPKQNAVHVPGLSATIAQANSTTGTGKPENIIPQKQKDRIGTKEQEQLNKITNNSSSRKWLRIAFFAWPVVSIVFNMIPFLRKFILNKIIGKVDNADVKVESIHLSLLKQSCMVKGFEYRNIGFNEDESLDCSVETAEVSFDWKALWRGVLICEMAANGIYFHIIRRKKTEDKSGYSQLLSQGLQTEVPLILKHLEIRNSRIGFTDMAGARDIHFEANDVRLTINRLSTVALNEEPLPTAISLRANIYDGFVTVRAKANLLGRQPAFDVDTELVALNMVKLNDFFQVYGKFDVHGGTLGFFSEIAAKDGKYKGYVKPIVRNLEIVGPGDQHETVLAKMWESAVATAVAVLKNQRKDQLATKVPFEGRFEPRVNVWYALFETLVNAFVQALKPSIDYEINIHSVEVK